MHNILPNALASYQSLYDLIDIMIEMNCQRKALKNKIFGNRITDEEQASMLYSKVIKTACEIPGLSELPSVIPQLILTKHLKNLPRQTFRLALIFVPLSIFLLALTFIDSEGGGLAFWVIRAIISILFIFPFLYYRRIRSNIEHNCCYTRKPDGTSIITIDELPAIQFQSYLAHEYAHHLYCTYFSETDPQWIREGWSRLVQWKISSLLAVTENEPSYQYHVLLQIIGEIKHTCRFLSSLLHITLPAIVRRIRTIYHSNSLFCFLTGKPGFDIQSLTLHGVGTSFCFLADLRLKTENALQEIPLLAKRDSLPPKPEIGKEDNALFKSGKRII